MANTVTSTYLLKIKDMQIENEASGSECILTIGIPTYNRAIFLREALHRVVSQVSYLSDEVEIIVADNASTDDTLLAVKNCLEKVPSIKAKVLRNQENLGFFGNAKRIRENSRGKYLWLLSDDDYIPELCIASILQAIKQNQEVSFIYLEQGSHLRVPITNLLASSRVIEIANYRLGFISAVIFLNEKSNDGGIFRKFNASPFIGLILALNSTRYTEIAMVIKGIQLEAARAKHSSEDFYNTFVGGMECVYAYLRDAGISNSEIRFFRKSYYLEFILPYYLRRKINREYQLTDRSMRDHQKSAKLIYQSFGDLPVFWISFPIALCVPRSILAIAKSAKRLL
jgi:glycosyltransferase involved in cell wall biosynthesis